VTDEFLQKRLCLWLQKSIQK